MQDLRRYPAGAQLEAGELGAVEDQALDAVPPEAPGAAGAGGAAADDDGVDRDHGAVLAAIDGFRERRDRRDRQAAARRARASRRRRSWRFKGRAGLAAAMACGTVRSDVAAGSDVLAAAAAGRRGSGSAGLGSRVRVTGGRWYSGARRSGSGVRVRIDVVSGRLGEAGGGAGLEDAQGAERLGELLVDPGTIAGEGEQALQAGLGGRVFLRAASRAANSSWRRRCWRHIAATSSAAQCRS